MTREDGWFDFMVNGGGAVTLQFGKSPFPPRIETLFAPWNEVVHNCTIFLCSLDVRNIVQGGDPLYAVFFSTQGSGGYT